MDHASDTKRNKRLEHKKKVETADANVKVEIPTANVRMEVKFNYFTYEEFDQPGIPGSGKEKMDTNLIMILDNMRHRSQLAYKINSGFRTEAYNEKIGGVKNSSHIKGKAVDIAAPDSKTKFSIIESALHFGIQRIGVGTNFIHIDIDDIDKAAKVCWTY